MIVVDQRTDEEPETPPEARRAIERAVWDWGIRGDPCALLAQKIFDALHKAGFVISERKSE